MKNSLVRLCAAFLFCCALVGLSGCATDYNKTYVGTWNLTEITSDDTASVIDADTITTLRNMGTDIFVNLYEDRTFEVSYAGNVISGTWDPQPDKIYVTSDGDTTTWEYSDKQLHWVTNEDTNTVMVFEKSDTAKAVESSD